MNYNFLKKGGNIIIYLFIVAFFLISPIIFIMVFVIGLFLWWMQLEGKIQWK
jgi:hypothetical protein